MRTVIALIAIGLGASGTIASAQAAESLRDCSDCPLMVSVPAGSFMMGSTSEETDREGAKPETVSDERPRHSVSVKQFSLSVAEVTRDQFDAFVRATGHQAGGPCLVFDKVQRKVVESGVNDWRDPGFAQSGNHPVVCVNWNDAKAYVRWLSEKTGKDYRLPTEAEWEFAARAGSTTSRYWGDSRGDDACRAANVADTNTALSFQCTDGYVHTAPVGQFPANAFGLHDILGNVWEWTEDCYSDSYNGALTNGSAWLTGDCSLRVYRGGSWYSIPVNVRAADRNRGTSTLRYLYLGFRVARTD